MSSMTKRQKETALVVLAAVFLLVMAAYSYFVMYAPARDARIQAEQTLSSEREVLMALENQLDEIPQGERINISDLQRKVSIDPLTELIVLQIEEAELLSETEVTNISITEGPFELLMPVEGVENIQEVLTQVEIVAADYRNITDFITEIEAMDRILVIDSISFNSPREVSEAGLEPEGINVTLSFSAFYRPDLIALADTMPKIDAPAPANKINPLPQNDGSGLELDETVADEADVEVEVEVSIEDGSVGAVSPAPNPNVASAQTETYHRVQKGDTLFSIAIQYYNNQDGMALIQRANDLPDQTVKTGTLLTIPARQ